MGTGSGHGSRPDTRSAGRSSRRATRSGDPRAAAEQGEQREQRDGRKFLSVVTAAPGVVVLHRAVSRGRRAGGGRRGRAGGGSAGGAGGRDVAAGRAAGRG